MAKGTLSLNTWRRDPVELFELALFTQRNRFMIEQAKRGERNTPVKINKADAERRLKAALAALQEGGAYNG